MPLQAWVNEFLHDQKVQALVLLVLADFLFGVLAALKMGIFRFSYIADFLRNDILFKLVPYFAFYAFAIVAGETEIFVFIDFGDLAGATYAALVAAWGASILNSIATLRLDPNRPVETAPPGATTRLWNTPLSTAFFGDENAAPPKD